MKEIFKISLPLKIIQFLKLGEPNTLYFFTTFAYKAKKLCFVGEKKFSCSECCLYIVPSSIFSIIWGHFCFQFLVCFYLNFLYCKIKKIENFQKDIYIYIYLFIYLYYVFCFLFILLVLRCITWILALFSWLRTCLTLWKNLKSVCSITECMTLLR